MGRRIYINIHRSLGTQCVHTSSSFPFKNNIRSWWKAAGPFPRVLGGELRNGGQGDTETAVRAPKGAAGKGPPLASALLRTRGALGARAATAVGSGGTVTLVV